jgi:hypothetical protein
VGVGWWLAVDSVVLAWAEPAIEAMSRPSVTAAPVKRADFTVNLHRAM